MQPRMGIHTFVDFLKLDRRIGGILEGGVRYGGK